MSCDRSLAGYSSAAMAAEPDTARRLGGSSVMAAEVLGEVFRVQEARMAELLAKYPRPVNGVPALHTRALDAQARDETLRLFRAIVAMGLRPPSHAEIAPGDDLPLPPLASQYGYAEVVRTLDAARSGRSLPDLAEEVIAAQHARATAAYAQAAQAAVRRIKNIYAAANGLGAFANQRAALDIARQIIATLDVPGDLRAAAEHYLAERGAGMVPFARALCRLAGAPRCSRCGYYVEQNHTCLVDTALATIPHLLNWGLDYSRRTNIPQLSTLSIEARQALANAAQVLEDGPTVSNILTSAAHTYRAWYNNRPPRYRTLQEVEGQAQSFLCDLGLHLAKTLSNDPAAAARVAGQIAARIADDLETLIKRTAMVPAAHAGYSRVLADLRQVEMVEQPETARARLSDAMRGLLNADGPHGAPTAALRTKVRSTYEELRPIGQVLSLACRRAAAPGDWGW